MKPKISKDLQAKIEAAARGAIHYHGAPCKRCSKKLRYIQSGGCVACQRAGAGRARKRLRELLGIAREGQA